jgi:peroxiredoxin/anti-anti-sigma regulatory factor
MVKASYDDKWNAVILEFSGNVDGAQAWRLSSDLEKILSNRSKGFTLLADFSSVETMEPEVEVEVKKAMGLFKAHGVSQVLRVLPDPDMDIGFNLLSHSYYSAEVKALTFRSRSQAEAHLRGAPDSERPATALKPGVQAPDFSLPSTPDQKVSLSEFRGRPVVLVFYPADWSPVCSDQLALYNELKAEFAEFNAQILGISVDGVWCHGAFTRDRKLHMPLLADFEPKGAVARLYGVYREKDGQSERALFVIDAGGVIRWSYISPVGVNPGADGILKALEENSKNLKAPKGNN